MKFGFKTLLPVGILVAAVAVALVIRGNPPEARQRPARVGPQLTVETATLSAQSYQIMVPSYGFVRPRRKTLMVSQVAGQIVSTAASFDEGRFFSKGEVLLRIDPRDYEADVLIAAATLADAKQMLAEEQARAEQALSDWGLVRNAGKPRALVLREPHMQAAQARVASAEASLTKAKLDLERTAIRAPYDGRVLNQMVELGQVVAANTQLGEIYSTDTAEVRLPIQNGDLRFVDLPERVGSAVPVSVYSELVVDHVWEAQIVRTEGAIDDTARQLHVIAEIPSPFESGDGRWSLKIGEYVTAQIAGRELQGVIMIPASAIYQGSFAYVVEGGLLQRRELDIAWSNESEALVVAGLAAGEELVTTLLGQVTSGVAVKVKGAGPVRQSRSEVTPK
jgi:RND family efflux transporter MFP subunit